MARHAKKAGDPDQTQQHMRQKSSPMATKRGVKTAAREIPSRPPSIQTGTKPNCQSSDSSTQGVRDRRPHQRLRADLEGRVTFLRRGGIGTYLLRGGRRRVLVAGAALAPQCCWLSPSTMHLHPRAWHLEGSQSFRPEWTPVQELLGRVTENALLSSLPTLSYDFAAAHKSVAHKSTIGP